MNETLIAIIVIIIAVIVAALILILLLRYKGSSPPQTCTASGQCNSGQFCNASGFCAPGVGAIAGQPCSSDSSCIIGLTCSLGTCQAPLTDLVPITSDGTAVAIAGTASSSNGSNSSNSGSLSASNTSTTNKDKFLLNSNGNIITVSNTPLYLTDAVPDQKVNDLKDYINDGVKPSYISSANSFSGLTISVNTSIGKYYLQVIPEGSYWINSDNFSSASGTKFSYDKSTNILKVGNKQVYVVNNGQSTQIKFSTNKSYLRTTSTTNDSRIVVERTSSGYLIRTLNGLYLTMDLTSATVSYAKYPAALVSLNQLNSNLELSYLQLGSYTTS